MRDNITMMRLLGIDQLVLLIVHDNDSIDGFIRGPVDSSVDVS